MSAEQTHGADCVCTRCRGFERGNEAAVRHGSYSVVKLGPRAAEIAGLLRAMVPGGDPVDGVAIEAAAMTLARLERAMAALDEVDAAGDRALAAYVGSSAETLGRLRQDARGWANIGLRFLDALALVPTSRGRLGLNVAKIRRLDLSRLSDGQLDELERLVEQGDPDA